MRIISKFHDYYDSAQAQGQDQTRVFTRHPVIYRDEKGQPSEVPSAFSPFFEYLQDPLHKNRNDGTRLRIDTFIVGFCGKLYPGAWLTVVDANELVLEAHLAYDFSQLVTLCDRFNINLYKKPLFTTLTRAQRYTEFFSLTGCSRLQELLSKAEHAIVYIATHPHRTVVINPVLRDIQFFRVFDAYSAFQELDMFLSSIAHPDKSMVRLSNEERIAKHGFDKWSFRKPPQEARKRARR